MPKVSNLQNLPSADSNDLIHILDVSEPLAQNINKTIKVEDLLSTAGGQGSPYVVINTSNNGSPLPNEVTYDIGTSVFIGGNYNNNTGPSNTPGPLPNNLNGLYVGNNNTINYDGIPIANPGYPSNTSIIGNSNFLYGYSNQSRIIGHSSTIKHSLGGLIVGTNSIIGQAPFDNTLTPDPINAANSLNYDYSIAIGDSVNIESFFSVGIGVEAKVYNSHSIAIGAGTKAGLFGSVYHTKNYATAIGARSEAKGRYSTCIGAYSTVEENAQSAIAIGGSFVNNTASYSIAIGEYSYTNGEGAVVIGTNASAASSIGGSIAIGYGTAARTTRSLIIGENSGVNATNNTDNIILGHLSGISSNCSESIVIGNDIDLSISTPRSCLIGHGVQILNNSSNSINIGYANIINTGSTFCSALGTNANIAASISNSVQLGTGTCSASNTLQFLTTPIANSTSIQASTQSTGVAPTSTPVNGTIIVDQSGNGRLYVRVNNTWKSVALA
jgi:hypothetical protein